MAADIAESDDPDARGTVRKFRFERVKFGAQEMTVWLFTFVCTSPLTHVVRIPSEKPKDVWKTYPSTKSFVWS